MCLVVRTVFGSCLRQLEILKENHNCSIRTRCLQASCWTGQEAPNKTKTETNTILSSYEICIWFGVLVISSFPEKQNEPLIHTLCLPFLLLLLLLLLVACVLGCHPSATNRDSTTGDLCPCTGCSTHPATAHCAVREKWWGEATRFLAVLSC